MTTIGPGKVPGLQAGGIPPIQPGAVGAQGPIAAPPQLNGSAKPGGQNPIEEIAKQIGLAVLAQAAQGGAKQQPPGVKGQFPPMPGGQAPVQGNPFAQQGKPVQGVLPKSAPQGQGNPLKNLMQNGSAPAQVPNPVQNPAAAPIQPGL